MGRTVTITAIHYLIRALLLGGFAFYIVYLVRNGNLNLYIAERMQLIVKLSALGLYTVAAQQFYRAIRTWIDRSTHADSCDCNHELPATWVKSLLLYTWFILPLAIGYVLPDSLLGSSMAEAKGVQFTPQQIAKPLVGAYEEEALEQLFPSDKFTESYAKFGRSLVKDDLIQVTEKQFIEILTTIDLYRTAFIGKDIQVSGFVHRENTMEHQQFGVSRFAINCCSADASPYGVMANFSKAHTLETDEWVTVTGKLGTTLYKGTDIIQINVDKVVRIPPPEEPYISPDLDFGLE